MPRTGFSNMSNVPSGFGSRLKVGLVAFNKHIATEMQTRLANRAATTLLDGSGEQQAIWDVLLNRQEHVIVEAVAGSGKTTTLLQYVLRLGNKADVDCMTYHSLGFKTVKAVVKHSIRVDQYKVLGILDNIDLPVQKKQEKMAKYRISSMVSFAKTYGHGPNISQDEMERIADRHDVDLNGLANMVYDYVPKVLAKCASELHTIDFDDMVWLPMHLGLAVPKYDVLCTDESQDLNVTQRWISLRGGNRICCVGDEKQSIYSFRGAGGGSIGMMRDELATSSRGVVTLPLTLTRRCPKAHVKLAQSIVPAIRALDDAPEGIVRVTESLDAAVNEMRPGDLVVCRVNAELIGTAYKLLKRGVKAVVRGKDIGQGMVKLIEHAEKRAVTGNLVDVLQEAGDLTTDAIAKFNAMPQGRGKMRAANAQDRYDCLSELATDCKSVDELKGVIENLFAEFEDDGQPKYAVVLGTVHRTKGLEGNRVFILRPDLIPHPMAKKPEDKASEMNLLYVACTRSKFDAEHQGELIFVGCECSALPALPPTESDVMEFVKAGKGAKHEHALIDPSEPIDSDWLIEDEEDGAVPSHRQ